MQKTNDKSLQRLRFVKKIESSKIAKETNKLSTGRNEQYKNTKRIQGDNLKQNIESYRLIEGKAEEKVKGEINYIQLLDEKKLICGKNPEEDEVKPRLKSGVS